MTPTHTPWQRAGLTVAVICLLAAVYMITYSGFIDSGDSLRIFDTISSQVRHDDFFLDESVWFKPPAVITLDMPYPLRELDVQERMTVTLASLLYRLADILPQAGFVHTVWLFNGLATALTGAVVFWWVLWLGYDARAAVITALAFGLGTIAWPYSKTLFRESFAMLMLAVAGLSLEVTRQSLRQRWLLAVMAAVIAAVILFAAYHTKESTLFALPGLLILLMPALKRPLSRHWQTLIDSLPLVIIALTALVVWATPLLAWFINMAQPALRQFNPDIVFIQPALHTYLFSVGGSIWGTSPMLLLALPGAWYFTKHGQRHVVWMMLIVLLAYAFGHAVFAGRDWYGGVSWPPRFLVPVVPLLMIGAAPVIDRALRSRSWRWMGPLIVLGLYSLWVQFNGVALQWTRYGAVLPPEASGLLEWGGGLNQVRHLRWFTLPSVWPRFGLDFAWSRAGIIWWPAAYGLLALLAGLQVAQITRRRAGQLVISGSTALLLAWIGITIVSLSALYERDRMYRATQPALHQSIEVLRAEAGEGDVLLLADNTYERFISNYYDLTWPRPIVLEQQPGEAPSGAQPAAVSSRSVLDLLTPTSLRIIDHLALKRERLWLLAHTTPYLSWSTRPVERYLAQRHYPLRDFATDDPTVRLIEYSTLRAPDPDGFVGPERVTDLRYGDHIRLQGITLPAGTRYAPGDVLALSLHWLSDAPLSSDYVVAWFLAASDGSYPPIQGTDSQPYAGFAPTTTWQPGAPVVDNRGLHIPADAPAGDYRLWVVLYSYDAEAGAVRLPVTGADVVEDAIGVLPVTIEIRPAG